jgi:penicillin amidase
MRIIKVVCVSLVLAWLSGAPSVAAPAPPASQTLRVAGLEQPVEILRDRWGVSHIYAKNEHDLFFAQGYNVARDRLFQLELWRRQATGTVAEILGPSEIERDRGTRLFMFRGDLAQELAWYHPRGAAIVGAFVDGINAYIDRTRTDPSLLTPEFAMLGITPGEWTPAVVISRFNGLLENVTEEIDMAQAVRLLGADGVKDLEHFQPPDPVLDLDPAIDASLLTNHILDVYTAFRRPIRFTPDELAPQYRGDAGAVARLDEASGAWAADPREARRDIGSNNWIVAGSRTASRLPMMANDPHRVQQVPSLRYWVHLVAPGWDVIGGGEPALPGVSIGHNQYGAWGLTVFGNDNEDLYVYDTSPANPLEYKYQGAWEPMRVVKDAIAVKGRAPVTVDLKYTRHGPVVYEDTAHHKAYAVRAAWMEIGSAPYLASLRMDQSRDWKEFRDACSYSRIPAENMVWAGVDGTIGYQAVGIEPLRGHWSGLVPVPGDGRYEWDGYLPIEALPHAVNPAQGFWNTSNEYLMPPDYPYSAAMHYLWADPFRASRVAEVLGSGRRFTVADMVQLQNDVLSIPARSLVPLLRDLPMKDARAEDARRRLVAWDYVLDKNSVAAGIYEQWQRHLQADVGEVVVPEAARPFIGRPSLTKVIGWMQAPDGRFGDDPTAGRDALLERSLVESVEELTKRFGSDPAKWTLGAYHRALIHHPLSPALNAGLRADYDVGNEPRSGDSYTIDATGSTDNQRSGGSFKIIADTSDWDNSVGLNNPGQSGDVNDPHYRDLYRLWSRGRYFPIFFSRGKVESVTELRLELRPAAAATTGSRRPR